MRSRSSTLTTPLWPHEGKKKHVLIPFDVLILWWLALGIPLSWKKGVLVRHLEPCHWIGVKFTPRPNGFVWMELPDAFVKDLLTDIEAFCVDGSSVTLAAANRLVGRAGRVAHVVPLARPFVSALWGCLAAGKRE